jgi:hypothetical protein
MGHDTRLQDDEVRFGLEVERLARQRNGEGSVTGNLCD